MNEAFRKEWKEREMPPGALLRARNRAWARRQKARAAGRFVLHAWHWAAASLSAVALLVLWLVSPGEQDPGRLQPAPAPPPVPAQSAVHPPNAIPQVNQPAGDLPKVHSRQARRAIPRTRKRESNPVSVPAPETVTPPRRVELNFTLAETGVRMIWILDSEFEDGGTR